MRRFSLLLLLSTLIYGLGTINPLQAGGDHNPICWLPAENCGPVSWTTVTPQFAPNNLTPSGMQPSPPTAQFPNLDTTTANSTTAGTAVAAPTMTAAAAVNSPWLTDRQLSKQVAAPKIDSLTIPSNCQCGDPEFCRPRTNWGFTLGIDALALQRSKPNIGLFTSALNVMNPTDDDYDTGLGTRLTMQFADCDCHTFQILYYGTDSWDGGGTYDSGAGTFAYDFRSQLFNWEVNFLRPHACRPWWTWILGVRHIEFAERLDFDSIIMGQNAAWRIRADNYIYALQAGVDLTLWKPSDRFELHSIFKTGGFVAAADNEQSIHLNGVNVPGLITINRFDPTGVLGDVGINLRWKPHRHFAFRAGYDLLVLTGVAQVPDILGQQSETHTVTFHGGWVGCELNW